MARATAQNRLAAARRLIAGGHGDIASAQRLLSAASANGIDMAHLWASFDTGTGQPRQVCLGVVGTGRSAMLFASPPQGPEQEQELCAVIEALCAEMKGVRLAQALLEPHESAAERAFVQAGFMGVGTLAYLRRPMPAARDFASSSSPVWPQGVVVRTARSNDEAHLLRAMDRSYEQTLDCPELCGLRDTRDVFESHRLTGVVDLNLWWVVELNGQAEGLMLLNPCPDQSTVELVYLGLSPALRGCGLGRLLLSMGLARLGGRSERYVTCAVDLRNAPALKLYSSLGFAAFAQRVALVKPLGERAVENRGVRR